MFSFRIFISKFQNLCVPSKRSLKAILLVYQVVENCLKAYLFGNHHYNESFMKVNFKFLFQEKEFLNIAGI